jgi:hypothetical protein
MIVPGKGSRILEGPMKHHLNLNFPLLAAWDESKFLIKFHYLWKSNTEIRRISGKFRIPQSRLGGIAVIGIIIFQIEATCPSPCCQS